MCDINTKPNKKSHPPMLDSHVFCFREDEQMKINKVLMSLQGLGLTRLDPFVFNGYTQMAYLEISKQ